MSEELRKRLEELKGKSASAAEMEAQRLSFIYGNAPQEDKGTKADVLRSITEPEYEPL